MTNVLATNNGSFNFADSNFALDVTGSRDQVALSGDNANVVLHGSLDQIHFTGLNPTVNVLGVRDVVTVSGGGHSTVALNSNLDQVILNGQDQTATVQVGGGFGNLVQANGATVFATIGGHTNTFFGSGHDFIDARAGVGTAATIGQGSVYLGGSGADTITFIGGTYVQGGSGADTFAFKGGWSSIGDFNIGEGDTLDLRSFGITADNAGMQFEVIGNALVIHPEPSQFGLNGASVLFGVGNQITDNGGFSTQLLEGHIKI